MTVSTGSVLDLKEISGVNWGDQSVHGNHGVLGDAEMKRVLANELDTVRLNGVDEYVSVAHDTNLNVINYTVLLWFRYLGVGTAAKLYWTLISKNSTGNGQNDPFHLWINATSGILEARFGDGTNQGTISGTTDLRDGLWHLAGLSYSESANDFYLYGDGELINNEGWTHGTPSTNTSDVRLGEWQAYHNHFNGDIYNPRLITIPLSRPEIAAIYEEEEPWFR